MNPYVSPRSLVVNFNSPELNQLALALARARSLTHYVRPYVNKGRTWERALATLPFVGGVYGSTFGRRRSPHAELSRLTQEAGVAADLCAAAIGRLHTIPARFRQRWTSELYKSVRTSVAETAAQLSSQSDCVIAYEGFALPAFESIHRNRGARAVLNYPVAHHRQRRRVRLEELEREPLFASTWPDFDDWPAGHEERLDAEIELAHGILVGSGYARDSFIAEGVAPDKVKVVPYGVDLETFKPPAQPSQRENFEVIYAGQLTQRKGLSYLLRGYRKFARLDSRLTLVGSMVGDPTSLLPYAKGVRHIAHQTRPALAEMYRQSDVFVFPTLIEGMPLVVLEAMACGLPVIVTANGPADIVRDGVDGFIIPQRDADAVTGCLERLYRDRSLRAEMGRNASERALEFGWGAYTSKAQAYLAQLTGGSVE